ncbi:MAG: hypothetical protein JNL12_07840 [Planctomycetes bacterium]|nr:hypothetical protein [Planctomycetota bacterium]
MPPPSFVRPAVVCLGVLLATLLLASCSTTWPRRDPTGEVFPTVAGTSLAGDAVTLPALGAGAPLLLLVGYEQEAQFDLDRWLLGLDQAGWRVRTFEVPTLPGLFPRLLAGTIDGGMRRGIPAEDWASVVTVYGDAARIADFTGNEDGLTGRVLLLDRTGKVVFFHDRGFSVARLKALVEAASGV